MSLANRDRIIPVSVTASVTIATIDELPRLGSFECPEAIGVPSGQLRRIDHRGTRDAGLRRRFAGTGTRDRSPVLVDENRPTRAVGVHRVFDDADVPGRVQAGVVGNPV